MNNYVLPANLLTERDGGWAALSEQWNHHVDRTSDAPDVLDRVLELGLSSQP